MGVRSTRPGPLGAGDPHAPASTWTADVDLNSPPHRRHFPQLFRLLLLAGDFLRFVKIKLPSFYVLLGAASPSTPWTPGPASLGQQLRAGPPAFALLKE